ncbi:hypothetical protein JCM10207_002961 [Rhodosporidiobolus poonsookiae]
MSSPAQPVSEEKDLERIHSSASSLASRAPPLDFRDLVVIYTAVADRRSTFDQLLWSVPVTSFTAQAFLFTTALAGDSSRAARLISMSISLLVTVMTIHLFTRQLQASDADHRWLDDFEERHNLPRMDRSHGARWSEYQGILPNPAKHFAFLTHATAFTFWANGMLAMGAAALFVLVWAAVKQDDLQVCGARKGVA